jgi:hypothetical protein
VSISQTFYKELFVQKLHNQLFGTYLSGLYFWCKYICAKAAHKILMKLAIGEGGAEAKNSEKILKKCLKTNHNPPLRRPWIIEIEGNYFCSENKFESK